MGQSLPAHEMIGNAKQQPSKRGDLLKSHRVKQRGRNLAAGTKKAHPRTGSGFLSRWSFWTT